MPITTTITPLPTAPDRTDPATFSDRADAWLSAIDNTTGQINTVASEMNAEAVSAIEGAEAARDAAQTAQGLAETAEGLAAGHVATALGHANNAAASANFAGAWSSLTGALTVPASVSHSGRVWLLLNTLADVTTSEPGVSVDWELYSAILNDYQEFLTSGAWSKPVGATWVYIEIIGGGGGGRGFNGTFANDTNLTSGGAGGEFVSRLFRASDLGITETVTIGAGGAGGAFGDGSDGGATSFGTHASALGGRGGGTLDGPTNLRETKSTSDDGDITGYFWGRGSTRNFSGDSVYGGAGGGSQRNSYVAGGVSEFAGDGGAGNGDNGSAPGGGGAAGDSTASGGGDGAEGRARVWAW